MSQRPSCPHSDEQHSVPFVQALPDVLQERLSEPHAPPSHDPEQHSAAVLQTSPSETQAPAEQVPSVQLRPQQSVAALQGTPGPLQALATDAQVEVLGLHRPEQQSELLPQTSPNFAHCTEGTSTGPAASPPASGASPPVPAAVVPALPELPAAPAAPPTPSGGVTSVRPWLPQP
jgi:hypothetical protein